MTINETHIFIHAIIFNLFPLVRLFKIKSYVPWQTDFLRPPLGGFPQSVTVSEWLWISLVHTPVNITLQDLVNHLLHVIYIYIDISWRFYNPVTPGKVIYRISHIYISIHLHKSLKVFFFNPYFIIKWFFLESKVIKPDLKILSKSKKNIGEILYDDTVFNAKKNVIQGPL